VTRLALVGRIGLLGLGFVLAARAAAGGAGPAEADWLQQVHNAAERLSYSGTIVHERGGVVRSSRVYHHFDGKQSQERVQLLDGRPREFVRHGNEVHTLMPEARRVRIEQRLRQDEFPALAAIPAAELLVFYTVRAGGTERVAGFEGRALVIEPKDAQRFGYRLWVEAGSNLLLKAQVIDRRQQVLEQMTFSELRIGGRFDRASLRPSWSTQGWTVERSEHNQVDLARAGWDIVPPPGFRLLRAVERKMGDAAAGVTLQAVYSDGLANVSVFIEPAGARAAAGEAVLVDGPASFTARRIGDHLVTVVGEVPADTVRTLAASIKPPVAR
jgi:sigma-E factor negative regulatory protein RseB